MDPGEFTLYLKQWQSGGPEDRDAAAQVYSYLRRVAATVHTRRDETLTPTALVHEAWVRMSGDREPWKDRGHFFATAAVVMRRILVDAARARFADKRGGGQTHAELQEDLAALEQRGVDLLALDRALETLARIDERQARVVELKFFAGLSLEETAAALEISERTARREWGLARAWLRQHLEGGQ